MTEYRDLVRWMLNTNQTERASAEEVFRSPFCMNAIKDNPELRYLEEHLNPVLVRKPSECAPQQTDEFGKQTFSNKCMKEISFEKSRLLLIWLEIVFIETVAKIR